MDHVTWPHGLTTLSGEHQFKLLKYNYYILLLELVLLLLELVLLLLELVILLLELVILLLELVLVIEQVLSTLDQEDELPWYTFLSILRRTDGRTDILLTGPPY